MEAKLNFAMYLLCRSLHPLQPQFLICKVGLMVVFALQGSVRINEMILVMSSVLVSSGPHGSYYFLLFKRKVLPVWRE